MKLGTRRSLVATLLALVACAPLVGLDELHDRPTGAGPLGDGAVETSTTTDAASEAAPEAAAPECTRHADCVKNDTNLRLCVEQRCTLVNKEYCLNSMLPISGDRPEQREDPLIIAGFVPTHAEKPTERPTVKAYNLALEEINGDIEKSWGGLVVDGRKRDVVMLLCASEPEYSEAALNHVVNDLKIPAVIAGFPGDKFGEYVSKITQPKGVFVMNQNETPIPVKYADTQQTVFSLLGPVEDLATAYRPLLDEMAGAARKRRSIPAGEPIRVSLIASELVTDKNMVTVLRQGFYFTATGQDLSQALSINDASVAVAEDGGTFIERNFPPREIVDEPDLSGVIADVAKFNPDIVIALTGNEIEPIVRGVEDAIKAPLLDGGAQGGDDAGDAGDGGDGGNVSNTYASKDLPIWILGPRNGGRESLLGYLDNAPHAPFETREQSVKRFSGIQYAGSSIPDLKTAWLGRMAQRYTTTPEVEYAASENSYDAVYWLAYGFYRGKAIKPSASDREAIKLGVPRLADGDGGIVGPGQSAALAPSLEILRANDGTYFGALGPPDIDLAHGMWRAKGTVFCYPDPGGFGTHAYVLYDHRTYDGGVPVILPRDPPIDCKLPEK